VEVLAGVFTTIEEVKQLLAKRARMPSPGEERGKLLAAAAGRSLLEELRLPELRVGKDWTRPTFVVFGCESTGKSTLLERITMMPIFPRGKGIRAPAPPTETPTVKGVRRL
jgi:hypothetical protein